ncbi:hypothetical protein [Streptomyces virginiae]|uniref:hypothetical protein n=1 Tax=Streptomyces virginiae TaxID=1961 RepID=UPI0034538E78
MPKWPLRAAALLAVAAAIAAPVAVPTAEAAPAAPPAAVAAAAAVAAVAVVVPGARSLPCQSPQVPRHLPCGRGRAELLSTSPGGRR